MKLLLVFFAALMLLCLSSFAETTDTTLILDDGPHVYWADHNRAIVMYVCGDSLIKAEYVVEDTLRFQGLCGDSSVEYVIPAVPPEIEPDQLSCMGRIFVVSDIHGEYDEFQEILRAGGVIDSLNHWRYGDGHLVIDGDIFDRGDGVTECLWLVYRLELEAKPAGGRVHYVMGNHELMVLRGDDRYVHERYLKGIARKSRIKHMDIYGPEMELGRWLRTKHAMVQLNDILFVHGGMHKIWIEQSSTISEINEFFRASVDVRSYVSANDPEVKQLFGSFGPFWYRGFVWDMEGRYGRATMADVDAALNHFGVSRIVVGHSERDSIVCEYDCKVITIDMPVETDNAFQAMLYEDGKFYRFYASGRKVELGQ